MEAVTSLNFKFRPSPTANLHSYTPSTLCAQFVSKTDRCCRLVQGTNEAVTETVFILKKKKVNRCVFEKPQEQNVWKIRLQFTFLLPVLRSSLNLFEFHGYSSNHSRAPGALASDWLSHYRRSQTDSMEPDNTSQLKCDWTKTLP